MIFQAIQGIVAPPISLNLKELSPPRPSQHPACIQAFTSPSSHTPTPEIHTSNSLHQLRVVFLLSCLNTEGLRPTLRACPPRRTCSARAADNLFVDLQTLPAHQQGNHQVIQTIATTLRSIFSSSCVLERHRIIYVLPSALRCGSCNTTGYSFFYAFFSSRTIACKAASKSWQTRSYLHLVAVSTLQTPCTWETEHGTRQGTLSSYRTCKA